MSLESIDIRDWLVQRIAALKNVDEESIDIKKAFTEYGLSSLEAVSLSGDLEELVGLRISPTIVFDYPSISSLSEYLSSPRMDSPGQIESNLSQSEPIAIVGMSCRFPGVKNPQEFWEDLINGVDRITEVPAARWSKDRFFHPDPSVPGKTASYWGGFLNDIDQFDSFFFGISPNEAKLMDPQQRLLMELSFEALDDAGQLLDRIDGSKTGVFMGISNSEYGQHHALSPNSITSHSGTGSALSIAANRISYFYNFRGPSMAIDTACSSSLSAVHLACQSIRNGECDLALAGGVNIILSPILSIGFTKAGVLSPDGKCKSFGADANGYTRGEGGGIIVLKSLKKAIEDGDTIHSIIRGSSIQQDGRTNGLMAPSQESQENLLQNTYAKIGIEPKDVQYIEAHGTGTLLGDSMEANAIGNVIGSRKKTDPITIGSVKSNIGHLEAAAGIAGLIKVVLSLKNRTIPASLNCKNLNPLIPFENLNIKVQQKMSEWPQVDTAIAGLSSFGFGGTNVHMVLQATENDTSKSEHYNVQGVKQPFLLPLSEDNKENLQSLAKEFFELLNRSSNEEIGDICYAASRRRTSKSCRSVCIGWNRDELIKSLKNLANDIPDYNVIYTGKVVNEIPKTAYVFSGHGGQWIGMGRELFHKQEKFKQSLEKTDKLIRNMFGWSVIQELLIDPENDIEDISKVQPCIFAIQLGLVDLWNSWGVSPNAVIAHSMGEVASAYIAGILSLESAIQIICSRSALMTKVQDKGTMLATELSEKDALKVIEGYEEVVSIGAINSPSSTFLSGSPDEIEEIKTKLENQNLFCKLVKVNIAPHSPQMDELKPEMLEVLATVRSNSPAIPFYSTVTGNKESELVFDNKYWVDNLRKPVLFVNATKAIIDDGYSVFVEIGPHPVLLGSIKQTCNETVKLGLYPSMKREEDQVEIIFRSLSSLYVDGHNVNWQNVLVSGKNTTLPSVIWNHERYWLDDIKSGFEQEKDWTKQIQPLLGDQLEIAHLPNETIWQKSLGSEVYNLIEHHKVDNQVVFPATGYIEIIVEALNDLGELDEKVISEIKFIDKLILEPENIRTIQIALNQDSDNESIIKIYSKTDQSWTLHVTAKIVALDEAESNKELFIPNEFIENSKSSISISNFYDSFEKRGIQYGVNFQRVKKVWRNTNEALGKVELTEQQQFDSQQFSIHPALLDACLQVTSEVMDQEEENLYLPSFCDSIQLYSKSPIRWSHVSMVHSDDTSVKSDIQLFDENERLVMELKGFEVRRSMRSLNDKVPENIWLYKLAWQLNQVAKFNDVQTLSGQRWLILNDESGIGDQIGQMLSEQGAICEFISIEDFSTPFNETSEKEIADLIERKFKDINGSLHGIIHLWSVDLLNDKSRISTLTDDKEYFTSINVLQIIQAISTIFVGSPKLWLITQGVQSIGTENNISVSQSPLWGLGKIISYEFPELKCTRIDLDPDLENNQNASQLFNALFDDSKEDQIAIRGNERYVNRILPYKAQFKTCQTEDLFKEDATYIITGGLSGLGLATAKWMSERGAGNLVLLGRSEPSESVITEIEIISEFGANIFVKQLDVCERDDLNMLVSEIKGNLPPLKGIIHSAGLVDDDSLLKLNATRIREVMAPKVTGTRNLHEATIDLSLDFFIMYSSAVSVLGSPGQGNYAAANAYLDTMAQYRQSIGEHGLTINWGPWAEIGLAVELTKQLEDKNASTEHLVKTISVQDGLQTIENLLTGSVNQAQITALPFNLKDLLELYPPAAGMAFFEDVGGNESHVSRLYARPNLKQEYVAPRTEVESKMVELWQQTLHIDKVGIRDSFFELGGDSVLAAQVLSLARKVYGINIDPKKAFESFTIESLAEMLEEEIFKQIEDMSEEEVQKLLSDEE